MPKFLRIALLVLLAPTYGLVALGQDLPSNDQILANLKYHIPELRTAELVMEPIVPSTFKGFHQGTAVINGTQQLPFLISDQTAQLLLLLSPSAIDVGRSVAEVEALQAEEELRNKASDKEKHEALLRFSEGMASRGPRDAPVTIFEFSDFQCPYCARGFATMEELLQRYPEKVRFVYLHLPLPNHDWAEPAAIAAVCAASQADDAFWTLHDYYFRNQQKVTLANLMDISRSTLEESGINMEAWTRCASDRSSAEYLEAAAKVEASISTAETVFGVSGTPGFFVNGRFLNGAHPIETFEALITEFTEQ